MFGFSTAKLIGLAVAAATILSFVVLAFHWKHQAADRAEKLTIICKATRDASDNPKLGCGNVPLQIGELGASVKNTKAALERQNAAVNAMAAASAKAQDDAEKAISSARERVKAAQTTSDRLSASARDNQRQKQPCEPSKELKGAWK